MTTAGKAATWATRAYAGAVIAAGAMTLVVQLPGARFDQPLLLAALMVASLALATSKVNLPIVRGQATVSMSYFTDVLALLLLGAPAAMLVAGTGAAAQCVFMSRSRPTWLQTAFSAAVLVLTIQATALTTRALGGFDPAATRMALFTTALAAATVFFLVNSWLVAVIVAQSRGAAVAATWHAEFLWTAPTCLVGVAGAVAMAHAAQTYLWTALLAAGPCYVTLKAYRLYSSRLEEQQQHVKEISDLHLASVEALARAIDARDQTIDHARGNDNHIRRVQAWATTLAEAAGMPSDEVEAIKVAALLHDIGKLAVPEHILSKPGRLTAKEFARIRIHPIVGAEIVKAVPFPYPVAPYVRSHHERWDGSGYPDGLRGEDIPLGARVLSVVDYFDALSCSRPYHTARPREEAVAGLRAEAGRALDPTLVPLFVSLLPAIDAIEYAAPSRLLAESDGSRGAPIAGLTDDRGEVPSWAFDNITLATQEMRALHDIAQTLGTRLSVDDTMALLSSKLNRLVPGACWVLYLYDEPEDVLRGRFATGLAADVVGRMKIQPGCGPSGWAARHRTPVLDACAAADFEAAGVPMIEPRVQAALSYPLVDAEALIGVLTVYHVERRPYSDGHQHVLDQVAGQAASVLKNAVAFERLRDVSYTDPLTELPNVRALTTFLQQRLLTTTPGKEAANAILMIDLNDFKAINDGFGHQVGDAALKTVAAVIRGHVRGADFCARYGGDEFVVALADCDRDEALRRARELQHAVGNTQMLSAASPGEPIALSISVGVGMFPADGRTMAELIATADRRMYTDKADRRRSRSAIRPAVCELIAS